MAESTKGFDLASVLKNVPELGTGSSREQIEYIDISLIDGDPTNFYELSGIEELAANIELIGLQQPLRVRPSGEDGSRFMIVSGHRRRAAMQKLVEDGHEELRQVPCIRETAAGSAALQELRLIFANSDTRKMSSADISKQAQRVEALLYQLKEEGMEFPGRMRDHVAQACQVSKSKLARLKVIRESLIKPFLIAWENDRIGESVAYALAQIPAVHQDAVLQYWRDNNKSLNRLYEGTVKAYAKRFAALDKLKCKKCGGKCSNLEGKTQKVLSAESWQEVYCVNHCCDTCDNLRTCRSACPLLSEKVKTLRADAKEQRKQEKLAQEEKDRPTIQKIQKYWHRFGVARNNANVSVKDYFDAAGKYYLSDYEEETVKLECLEAPFKVDTELPYGYHCSLNQVERYVKLADLLGCSLDYLLCRTDNPQGFPEAQAAPQTADPAPAPADEKLPRTVWYPKEVEPPAGSDIIALDPSGYVENVTYAGCCILEFSALDWNDVIMWTPAPSAVPKLPEILNSWQPGKEDPPAPILAVAKFAVEGTDRTIKSICKWNGKAWTFENGTTIDAECVAWFPLPEE